MGITDNILGLVDEKQRPLQPQEQSNNWVKDLISQRYQPKTERLKRAPVGFEFKRDPFDPSSYYNDNNLLRQISQNATAVTNVETSNKLARLRERDLAEQGDLSGVHPNFTGGVGNAVGSAVGKGRVYKLGGVTANTAKAAGYFGSKYGIKTIGGYREHGSVPGSDHPKGRALDYMINNIGNGKRVGDSLANDLIKNYKAWNIKYVIWNRYIWSPGKGWRRYNGPSPHTDHVHASFNK